MHYELIEKVMRMEFFLFNFLLTSRLAPQLNTRGKYAELMSRHQLTQTFKGDNLSCSGPKLHYFFKTSKNGKTQTLIYKLYTIYKIYELYKIYDIYKMCRIYEIYKIYKMQTLIYKRKHQSFLQAPRILAAILLYCKHFAISFVG